MHAEWQALAILISLQSLVGAIAAYRQAKNYEES
jgi:hypothetical protein